MRAPSVAAFVCHGACAASCLRALVQVRGFSECTQALRPGLDAVHDVTIAYHNYKGGGPPSEKTMLAGQPP